MNENNETANKELLLKNELSKILPAISSVVPKHMTPEKLLRLVLTTTQQNPKLMNCTPLSIIGAVVNCASLGLEPNLLGHAYLIPYFNSKTKQNECQFQIGYKGYIDLVLRSGNVQMINAHVVYENDSFDYELGLHLDLRHKPSMGERGKPIFYYSTYKMRDGGFGFEVMSREQIEQHCNKFSKSKTYGPWVDNFDAMALKTVTKRMVKWMPLSVEVQKSITSDEQTISLNVNKMDVLEHSYAEDTLDITDDITNEINRNMSEAASLV